jgi:hypothetical protein
MEAESAGHGDTSTPRRSSGRVPLVNVAARYDAARGAGSKRPERVSREIGAPRPRSYAARRAAGTLSSQSASTSPTLPTVLRSSSAKRR